MPEYSAEELLNVVNSSYVRPGNERARKIVERLINDVYQTMIEFNVTHDELWAFNGWVNALGKANHAGLLTAGIGLERLIDIMADEADKAAGRPAGTPRAIEGPLYVPGAPQSKGEARLDDGTEQGEVLIMAGVVRDAQGQPVPGAIVDIWHANQRGTYSFVDPSQSEYNYRRKIETDAEGRYHFRSMVPPGYAVPPDSPTQAVLDLLGRDGKRPAHIHFMVSAKGHTTLTTQVNLPNDPNLNTDFAFGTRDELIATVEQVTDPARIQAAGLTAPFSYVAFDLRLQPEA